MAPSVDRNTKVTSSGASYVRTGVSKSAYWARGVCTINCDSALVGSLDGVALHNFSWDRFRIQGSGCRVQGSGRQTQGSESRPPNCAEGGEGVVLIMRGVVKGVGFGKANSTWFRFWSLEM